MSQGLGGIDFSQYQNWRVVRTPSGGVYYAVPNTPYVYDPFLSAQRGKPVLWQNPEPSLNKEQQAEQERQEALAMQRRASSPEGQLIPVAGTVAGTAGTAMIINSLREPSGVDPNIIKDQVTDTAATTGSKVPAAVANNNPSLPVQPELPGDAFVGGAMGPQSSVGGRADVPVVNDVKVVPPGAQPPDGYTVVGQSATGDGSQIAVPSNQVGQDGSINFGQAAQGLLAGYQMFQGFRALKDGDYLGGGLGVVGGGANLMASGLVGAGAKGMATNALGGYLMPGLNIAAGLYTGYKTEEAISSMPQGSKRNMTGATGGAATGAALGTAIMPGLGTAIGAGVGALVGWGASLAGSGKDKYQMIRDKGRDYLQENKILDENYMGTLADGSKFDFGKDGKKYGKVDFKNPLAGEAAAFGNVLASVEGLSGRGREAMAMLYTNGAISNAGKDPNVVMANYRHFFQQRGITYDAAKAQLDQQLKDGKLTEHEHSVYTADLGRLLTPGKQPPAPAKPAAAPAPAPAPAAPAPGGAIAATSNLQVNRSPGPAPTVQATPPPAPARSSTLSPGINLQGQRVPYGRSETVSRALARRMDRR